MGITGIEEVFFNENLSDPNGSWTLQTQGSNLREIISHPDVIFDTVESNSMWEMLRVLGIEAARYCIIKEMNIVLSMGKGLSDDTIHLELLADAMTYKGTITAISSNGLGKDGVGPLARASFEQSSDNLSLAGRKGEVETINGISAAIILGQHGQIGSGMMDVYTNTKMLEKHKFQQDKLPVIEELNENISLEKSDVQEC